jgi:hypothetical protein
MRLKNIISIVLIVAILALLFGLPIRSLAVADSPVFTDALASGWEDWSWTVGTNSTITRSYTNSGPIHSGTASVAVTYTGGWSGLQIGFHGATLDISAYDTFRFWIHGGTNGGQTIQFQFSSQNGSTDVEQDVTPQANVWTRVDISLLDLGSPRTVYKLVWFNNTSGAQPTFYLDDLAFVDSGAPTPTPPPPGIGPGLSVDAAAGQHAISPYIYGMNFASEEIAQTVDLPVRRWGGNSTSRYNWQYNVSNTGSDWYFENIVQEVSTDDFIEQNQRTATKTLLTMPLISYISKNSPANHPFNCGFKVSKYGSQQQVDPWDTDCGNGVLSNGTEITGNDPLDTSLLNTTTLAANWVNHLTATYGTSTTTGVMFYDLDNEPMLWNSTHRDVHPAATTYNEMRDLTWAYAAAIKAADPGAKTLGPVVWGWCAYFYSAADGCSPGSDRASHGNLDFIEWYLQQMRSYEQTHGVRILDYVDVHVYPQVNGVFSDSPGSTSLQATRLRSTRQLWDPAYIDESWIGQAVYLIPRMKQWVAADYPGTKLAITEYNWGALGYMNGALAQADILGIFGREGLDLATLWGPPDDVNAPGIFAFRMYRNYDGLGGSFGDTSLQAASTDQEKLAVYAARRSSDGALTLMVINKTGQVLTSELSLANFSPASTARVYRYSSADLAAILHESDQAVTSAGFTATYPANSITLVILPPSTTSSISISGNVGIAGARLDYNGGFATAGAGGAYSITLPSGWTGTVRPSLAGYIFIPSYRSYTDLASDQTGQDYAAHIALYLYLPLVMR